MSAQVTDKTVVEVRGLSKMYPIYDRPHDLILELMTGRKRHRPFWALKDINLEIRKGEVVGILGRNGAGKSTLLKILAGTLRRYEGDVALHGRISAILELGSGFHPDYTGRENVMMGGLCLGMSREEIERKMDEIIAFSELEAVIDQPFRSYSSGMQARLTFATAISVDPEILIVDEALAVGDSLFQKKCFDRIKEITDSGATVLLVTHSIQTVVDTCTRAILLHHGSVLKDGTPRNVRYAYEHLLITEEKAAAKAAASAPRPTETEQAPTSAQTNERKAEIKFVDVLSPDGTVTGTLEYGKDYQIRVRVEANADCPALDAAFRIVKPSGQALYLFNTEYFEQGFALKKGETVDVVFSFRCSLGPGAYFINAGLRQNAGTALSQVLDFLTDTCEVAVVGQGPFSGDVDLGARLITVKPLPSSHSPGTSG